MNESSTILFDISHVIKNIRDTLEFCRPNEVAVNVYEARKKVVSTINDPKTICGRFFEDNKEKFTEIKKRYDEFLEDVYGEDSTILTKTTEGKIRVDHTQDMRLITDVVYISEPLRDLLFGQFNGTRNRHLEEAPIVEQIDLDERIDRAIKMIMLFVQYQKSFSEFQKVMNESKGQPSPQSNFIVQNELQVLAQAMHYVRSHCHFIDNRSLDVYDQVIQVIEMCEGRRERRDNKTFPVLFDEATNALNNIIKEVGVKYDECYKKNLNDMVETIKQRSQNNEKVEA